MTSKEKRYNVSEEQLDKIIKQAIETEMDDGKDIITDKELIEMGYPLPPADMLDRIKNADNVKVADVKKPRFRKTVLLVAIIAILISVFVTIGVSGSKEYFFGIVSKITNNSIQFSGINQNLHEYSPDEDEAYKVADETAGFTILKPTYMPEGFEFKRIKIYPNDNVIISYRFGDKNIVLSQTLLKEELQNGEMVDIKDGKNYTIDAHDTKITIGEYQRKEKGTKWYSAVWYNENIMYSVDSDCSQNEFEEFIKGLK